MLCLLLRVCLYLCMCICTCVGLLIHVPSHLCLWCLPILCVCGSTVCIPVSACVPLCACMYICTPICMHAFRCVYLCVTVLCYHYVYLFVCMYVCIYVCLFVCVCVDPWAENAACGWNLAHRHVWFGPHNIFNILSQHLKIRIFHIKIQLSSFS